MKLRTKVFTEIQNPIPEGLLYWYEYRGGRLIVVSWDQGYRCNNELPVPDHKLASFEEGARWSEVRKGQCYCRCRILGEVEAERIFRRSVLNSL